MNETYDKTIRESRLPEVWPGWETVEELGKGSFGAVYKIRRQMLSYEEYAAVKYISIPGNASEIADLRKSGYDDESITENFREQSEKLLREYALMRSLNGNTNIVSCDDVRSVPHADDFGMDLYIKMELLTPLDSLEQSSFHEEEITRLGVDLCTALELCEKNHIIHRDIKPANIFVSKNRDYKLGDFGVSRIMESTGTNGGITGTPRYMAPEVYANRKYGHTADIYSLGLVLYWLLNERRTPFQPLPPAKLSYSGDQEAISRRMKGEAIPAPKNGTEALKKIVLKACAYDPRERYQSTSELKCALTRMESPSPDPMQMTISVPKPAPETLQRTVYVTKPATETPQRQRQPQPKKRWWLIGAPVVLALLMVFALGGRPGNGMAQPEPTPNPENSYSRGDIVTFGSYEQDGKTANGAEPIEWIVLEFGADGKQMKLLSKYALDAMPFDSDKRLWGNSDIRKWLNEDFWQTAFTPGQQLEISTHRNVTPRINTIGSETTEDKVFLLSVSELEDSPLYDRIFCCQGSIACRKLEGVESSDGNIVWWLRNTSYDPEWKSIAHWDGSLYGGGTQEWGRCCVRPAIWVDISGESVKKAMEEEIALDPSRARWRKSDDGTIHVYELSDSRAKKYDTINADAEKRYAHLATISSKEENDLLLELYRSKAKSVTTYFGYSDEEQESQWKWVTGEQSTYTNWYPNEPNGAKSENFGAFYGSFSGWIDADLKEDFKHVILEWEFSFLPETVINTFFS